MDELMKYFDVFKNKRILIIGDAIIDHYIYGSTTKLSPDAPVPLVDVSEEKHFIGSLGRVIEYVLKMNAWVDVVSCVGKDFEGQMFLEKMEDLKIKTDGIVQFGSFTPKISRIISREQQLLRIEKKYNLNRKSIKEF
ncbi:MAG: D-glycero-beta-D-manno-heptose-7-phosphate kinase, partial [Promethearchaeota archaeon]